MLSNDIFMNTITNEDFGVFDKIRNGLTKFGKGVAKTAAGVASFVSNPIAAPTKIAGAIAASATKKVIDSNKNNNNVVKNDVAKNVYNDRYKSAEEAQGKAYQDYLNKNKESEKTTSATVTQNPIIDPDSLRKGLGTSGSGARIISAPTTPPVTSKPKMIPTHVSSKPKPIIATSPAGKRVAVSTSMTI